jgi:virulence factor Mce-like protein
VKMLDKKTRGDFTKLVIFMVVTALATGVLIMLIGNLNIEKSRTYKAIFSDATGVVKGDDIRVAGVKVGSVKDVQIVDRTRARITFTVRDATSVTRSSTATIRYRNLVGQRYIALTEGDGSAGRTLEENALIPLAQTTPALDLTTLFGGFQPLLQALSPADVNRVSYEIIQVFQGEAGTVQSLLQHVASLTDSLADKDAVIGSVIDNLTTVMQTVAERDQQLSGLIVSLQEFVTGLASDREAIFDSLETIDQLAGATSGFLEDARPPLAADIQGVGDLSRELGDTGDVLEHFLQLAPTKIDLITRTAVNGSWFNFFLCNQNGTITLPPTTTVGDDGSITTEKNAITVPKNGSNQPGCS